MKRLFRRCCLMLLLATLALFFGHTAEAAQAQEISANQLRQMARDTYFWGWPMANIYNRRLTFEKLKEPALMGGIVPVAPPNRLAMLTDYIDPAERLVACPNQDVVYGAASLALDIEPVVVQVPDFKGRFWVYQAVDIRTDSFAELGAMYGTPPGFYLLVGPDWQGQPPKGIVKVFRSPSNTGMLVPRVFQSDSPEDKKAVRSLISDIDAYPLSQYSGKMKRRDWSKLPKIQGEAQASAGEGETKWVIPETFWNELPSILADAKPFPGEEYRYEQARILAEIAKSNAAKRALLIDEARKTDAETIDPLLQLRNFGRKLPGNWGTIDNGAAFKDDYFTRTAVARSNILVNPNGETKYFYQDLDEKGRRLNGGNAYTVTFDRETVPVRGFWSLTLYNEHHFFAPNALGRYSLGTKNKNLKRNPDGTLTLYVQPDSPGSDLESNWLPSPRDAEFSLYIRAYWPGKEILDGQWTPPPVMKATSTTSANSRYDHLGAIPFPAGYPSNADIERLRDEIFFERAVQSYIWALPSLNVLAMKEGAAKYYGSGYPVVAIWKDRLNAKTLIATPNSDVIYGLGFFDLKKDGPMVIEIPPGMQGILDDFYQRPIASEGEIDGKTWAGDVGLPGPDQGKGGKYLILPPDYKGEIPSGFYVFRSRTYGVMMLLRGFFKNPKDLSQPVQNMERTRIYPLGKRDSAPAMQFPNASRIAADLLYPKDGSAFDLLSRYIDAEYPDPQDMEMRGMLAAIGIVKGQPFAPDARQRQLLDLAAKTASKYSLAVSYTPQPIVSEALWYSDRRWLDVFPGNATFTAPTFNYIDPRTGFFANAFTASPGMAISMEKVGAKYPATFVDSKGDFLNGSRGYKLTLPKGIPAAIFWSVTIYDSLNASQVDNGQPFPSINTMDRPIANADGSTDVYFGPQSPGPGKNWIRTLPDKGFFVLIRLYGPTKSFFDKSWKPGDLERQP